jgi:hypothetical protein
MSVNLGGVAVSDAGEGVVDALEVEAGVLVAVTSAGGEVAEGRVPTSVADGVWASAMLWQTKNASAQMIVFTVLYLGRSVSFVDSLMTKSVLTLINSPL